MYSIEIAANHKLEATVAFFSENLGDGTKGLFGPVDFWIDSVAGDMRKRLGMTSFAPLPGCCGIVISYHTALEPQHRGNFYSDYFRQLKEKIAKEMGYSLMIATTQMENIPAVGNFFKSKYKFVETFTNSRTGNLIGLGVKKLV